jgi:hypothetical protein
MFWEREFFVTLIPTNGTVLLGDGKTTLSIKGVGTVKCKIGSNTLVLQNVRYIPDLSESIYSLFLHVQSPFHKLESTFDDGLYIIFPDFKTKAIIGSHDIYLGATPVVFNSSHEYDSILPLPESSLPCYHVTNFQSDIDFETHQLDNILRDL